MQHPSSVAALALAALLPQDPVPGPVQLRHKLEPNARFAFAVEVEANVTFDTEKKNSALRFAMHFVATVAPAAAADEVKVVCRLARVEARVQSPGARTAYDSDRGDEPGPLQQLAELVGKEFAVRIDPRGRHIGVDVPEPLAALARDRLGADFESLFAAYFLPLPSTPMGIGDGWDADIALVDPGPTGASRVRVANRLLSITDGRATIGRTLHLPTPPVRPGIRFEVQKAAGTAVFDVDNGRVVTADLELIAHATRTEGGKNEATNGTSTLRIRAFAEKLPPPPTPPPPTDR